jgi:hypothetical protein
MSQHCCVCACVMGASEKVVISRERIYQHISVRRKVQA